MIHQRLSKSFMAHHLFAMSIVREIEFIEILAVSIPRYPVLSLRLCE